MQLTRYSEYAFRVLMYLAYQGEESCKIQDIADNYNISKNHLMKIVHQLSKLGYIDSTRGRFGGIKLALAPNKIILGAIVRHTEANFRDDKYKSKDCCIHHSCQLNSVIEEGLASFLKVLDGYSLADIMDSKQNIDTLIFPITCSANA